MKTQNENQEFDKLLKLMALKRLEKPPVGYFNNFSARVINKIESQQEQVSEGWFITFWKSIISRPVLAGACVVLLMLAAIASMRPAQTSEIQLRPGISQNNPWELNVANKQSSDITTFSSLASGESKEHSSTNPVTPHNSAPSLFQQIPTLVNPTPANYTPRQ